MNFIIFPIVSVILLAFTNMSDTKIKSYSLLIAIISAVLAMGQIYDLWIYVDGNVNNIIDEGYMMHMQELNLILTHTNIRWDSTSIPFVVLNVLLYPLLILASYNVNRKVKLYFCLMLIIQPMLNLAFLAENMLVFYVAFESVLIPLFLMINLWGASENKTRASYLLFIYTLIGSMFRLFGRVGLYNLQGSSSFKLLLESDSSTMSYATWLCIFIALAVKTPLLPFHIWLTRAHVEAPVAVSMLLAGVVLKLATYGFIRILVQSLPTQSIERGGLVQTLCVITMIYSSLTTLRQTDVKVAIAYSSVAHRSVVVFGIFNFTTVASTGAMLLSLAHGIVSPAIFFILGGIVYDRYHSRNINDLGGLISIMPITSLFMFLFILGNMATPPTLSWVAEMTILASTIITTPLLGAAMSSSIVLSAAYSIWLFVRVYYGKINPQILRYRDRDLIEFLVLIPLLLARILLGMYPNHLIEILALI